MVSKMSVRGPERTSRFGTLPLAKLHGAAGDGLRRGGGEVREAAAARIGAAGRVQAPGPRRHAACLCIQLFSCAISEAGGYIDMPATGGGPGPSVPVRGCTLGMADLYSGRE